MDSADAGRPRRHRASAAHVRVRGFIYDAASFGPPTSELPAELHFGLNRAPSRKGPTETHGGHVYTTAISCGMWCLINALTTVDSAMSRLDHVRTSPR